MRPTFLDEQVGNDGKRYYNIVQNGAVLYEKVLLEKDYIKLQDGTKLSANILINMLTEDNILNYKGVKKLDEFGDQIVSIIVDTENNDDIILKKTTTFGDTIAEQVDYYQAGVVIYSIKKRHWIWRKHRYFRGLERRN